MGLYRGLNASDGVLSYTTTLKYENQLKVGVLYANLFSFLDNLSLS